MTEVAAWISAGAAVVSIGAAIWSTRKGAKAAAVGNRLQAKLTEIEQAREQDRLAGKTKAQIKAAIMKEAVKRGVYSYNLILKNAGLASARNVVMKPASGHRFTPKLTCSIDRIDAGATHPIVLSTGLRGAQSPVEIEITWEDDSGERGHFRTTLSL